MTSRVFAAVLLFGLWGCQWRQITDKNTTYYPVQGFSVYKGQKADNVLAENGEPNIVRKIDDERIMWVYYTSYRPSGRGEIITYTPSVYGAGANLPAAGSSGSRAAQYNTNGNDGLTANYGGGTTYTTAEKSVFTGDTTCTTKIVFVKNIVADVISDCN